MKVVFTGIPGVDIGGHVEKLIEFLSESPQDNHSVIKLKAEQYFLKEISSRQPEFLQKGFDQLLPSQQMIYVLRLPKPFLRQCWTASVQCTMDEGDAKANEKDHFLFMHAVMYHQQTREFFCPVDIALLRKWCPSKVITLIDDIDNVMERLMLDGQMFSPITHDYTGPTGPALAINNVRLLYDWRAIDLLSAERLASDLGIKHYYMSVKHPASTFASLIYKPARPLFYISHPISEPRRSLLAGKKKVFDTFTSSLENSCQRIRKACALIEPTAVDEFRFRHFTIAEKGKPVDVHLPSLTQRWPLPVGSLWKRPTGECHNPFDPAGVFSAKDMEAYEIARKAGKSSRQSLRFLALDVTSNLLSVLVGSTGEQIDTRDHKLVEQSDGLIVLRPVYNGHSSKGVLEEVHYHCRLSLSGSPRLGGIWIYTHADDEFSHIMKVWIPTHMNTLFSKRHATHDGRTLADALAVVEEVTSGIPKSFWPDRTAVGRETISRLAKKRIHLVGTFTTSVMSGEKGGAAVGAEADFLGAIQEAKAPYRECLDDYTKKDPVLNCTIREGPSCTLDAFLREFVEFCNKLVIRQ